MTNLTLKELKKNWDKLLVLIIYISWVVKELFSHSMWRDELQAWLIGANSSSLKELIINTRYEGRPPLWHALLWLIAQLTDNPELAKILILVFSIVLVVVVLFYLQINTLISILILSSFLFLGGYTTLLRDYALLLLLFMLLVVTLQKNLSSKNIFILGALFALTNLFGLIVAASLFSAFLINVISRKENIFKDFKTLIGLFILASTIIVSMVLINPPPNNQFKPSPIFSLEKNALDLVSRLNSTFFPIPIFINNFIVFVFVITLIIMILIFLIKTNLFIFTFVFTSLILTSLNYMYGYAYYWWHFGMLFLVFLSGLLAITEDNSKTHNNNSKNLLLIFILIPYIAANFWGPGSDIFSPRPYSNAKNVASFLEAECMPGCEIIVNLDYAGTSVSAYLSGKPIFFANSQQYGTFVVWNKDRGLNFGWDPVMSAVPSFTDPYILIVGLSDPPKSLELVAEFKNAIWTDEDFSVYKLKKAR